MGKKIEIEVLGRKFKSLREACRFHGFNVQTIDYRIKHGMSLGEAFSIHEKLTHYTPSSRKNRITFNGQLITDIAKETGEKYNTIYYRLRRAK